LPLGNISDKLQLVKDSPRRSLIEKALGEANKRSNANMNSDFHGRRSHPARLLIQHKNPFQRSMMQLSRLKIQTESQSSANFRIFFASKQFEFIPPSTASPLVGLPALDFSNPRQLPKWIGGESVACERRCRARFLRAEECLRQLFFYHDINIYADSLNMFTFSIKKN
jgi:hypothetical protein